MNLTERTRNTIRNSLIGVLMQGVMVVSSFICRMIFVRCLAEEYLGVSGLFSNVLSMLSLAELGIGSAIIYELYHALAYEDGREIAALMAFYKKAYVIIGNVIGICGIALMPFLHYFVKVDSGIQENIYILYLLYLLNTVISYFFSYRSTIIEAAQCNFIVTIVHTLCIIGQNAVQCFILLIYRNFFLYVIIQIAFTLIYSIIIFVVADRMFPVIKKRGEAIEENQRKRMFANVKAIFISSLAGRLVGGIDNIIITAIGGLAETGLNSNYALISQTLTGFTTKIQQGIRSSVGNVVAIENDDRKLELFNIIFLGFFWMYFWCTCCYILLVQDVIELLFGPKYVMPFSVALMTGINLYALEMNSVIGIFKGAMGLFRYGKYITLFTGGVNLFCSIVLGNHWGVFGILAATFIARMVTEKWYLPYVTFKFGFHISAWYYFKRDIRYWLEGIVIFCITCFFCELVEFPVLGDLIYRLIICIVIPNMLLIIFHRHEREYKEILKRIRMSMKMMNLKKVINKKVKGY